MERQANLYYREGSSDKVYQAQLKQVKDGYKVEFQYGRRGGTLAVGTKTINPVDLDTANKLFDALVKSKKAKGYTEGDEGTPYLGSSVEDTGIHCQLLTE
jgi:bifunctional non-homologous end joining protein LigD